ncbi:HAD-IB family hydrolase [Flavitalea antarctica]
MRYIAFFDFDGTITKRDTLLEFIKFSKGNLPFYIGFLLHAPVLIAYKIGLLSNKKAKEKILGFFFSHTDIGKFHQDCKQFSLEVLPKLVRPKALEEIQKLNDSGATVVIVTASAENWVKPWADTMQLDLIGTKLEEKSHKLTGKIQDINCHGEEKVRRIMERYSLKDYDKIYAYGDTRGDKPMLKLAHEAFYKPFR